VSGFAGIVRIASSAASAEADRLAIERMARAIAFRGPDSLQQTHQPGATFAFSLLATGSPQQESSQPCTLDAETWFLGDARCDGRDELNLKLEQHGLQITNDATSERLILHAFQKFGEAGLPELHGDFSFVLWNSRIRKLLAFRDLTGSRPFFYAHHDGILVFSNTIQAVLAAPTVSREFDEGFLADFLLGFPYQDPGTSVYRSIRRLPPGHLLVFSESGISIRRIANMPVEELLLFKRGEEYVEEFRRLLDQAVRERLPSVDTTVFLSGGLDSTTIAARIVSVREKYSSAAKYNLRAFSVDLQPLFDDRETELASRFAEMLGIPCEILHSGDVLPFAGWKEFPALLPEPSCDPYSVVSLSHYRHIAKHSRVAFEGTGGDELLRLQAFPYLRFLVEQGRSLAAVSVLGQYVFSQRRLPPLGAGIRSGFMRLFRKKATYHLFPPWFTPEFERRMHLSDRWRALHAPPPSPHPFNSRAYLAVNGLSVASVLELSDPYWTGCHTEIRAPFLDRRLARFMLRIPPVPWAMDKYLIRRSQIGVLPDEIRLRPKTPILHDVLLLHAGSGKWHPARTPDPPALLRTLVDWPKVIHFLEHSLDESLYAHLRPVALTHWLKNIENQGSLQ
jgi:asparagine synthase (glutamine-hydrolysing)